jgi:hypothetical protein
MIGKTLVWIGMDRAIDRLGCYDIISQHCNNETNKEVWNGKEEIFIRSLSCNNKPYGSIRHHEDRLEYEGLCRGH